METVHLGTPKKQHNQANKKSPKAKYSKHQNLPAANRLIYTGIGCAMRLPLSVV